jgi:hypothetical protein
MYSSVNPETLLPKRAFDIYTGEIDPTVIEYDWVPHDIALLADQQWDQYGPLFEERIRIVCGDLDSFYLERAVIQLKEIVEKHRKSAGDGYIEILKGADHNTVVPRFRQRSFQEMRKWLEKSREEDN